MVETKEGITYFGMHSNDFYDPKEGIVTLHVVREIPSPLLRGMVDLKRKEPSQRGLLKENRVIDRIRESDFIWDILEAQGWGRKGFKFSDKVWIGSKDIVRMEDLPELHKEYHKHNIKSKEDGLLKAIRKYRETGVIDG